MRLIDADTLIKKLESEIEAHNRDVKKHVTSMSQRIEDNPSVDLYWELNNAKFSTEKSSYWKKYIKWLKEAPEVKTKPEPPAEPYDIFNAQVGDWFEHLGVRCNVLSLNMTKTIDAETIFGVTVKSYLHESCFETNYIYWGSNMELRCLDTKAFEYADPSKLIRIPKPEWAER